MEVKKPDLKTQVHLLRFLLAAVIETHPEKHKLRDVFKRCIPVMLEGQSSAAKRQLQQGADDWLEFFAAEAHEGGGAIADENSADF